MVCLIFRTFPGRSREEVLENSKFGQIFARSAIYVGMRFKSIVCLSVCLSVVVVHAFFGVLLPGYGACFIHLLTDVLTQKSRFGSFGPKMSQFEIELPIRSSGLGVPKTVYFSQKRTSEIELPIRSSGLRVPETDPAISGDSRPCSAECYLVKVLQK